MKKNVIICIFVCLCFTFPAQPILPPADAAAQQTLRSLFKFFFKPPKIKQKVKGTRQPYRVKNTRASGGSTTLYLLPESRVSKEARRLAYEKLKLEKCHPNLMSFLIKHGLSEIANLYIEELEGIYDNSEVPIYLAKTILTLDFKADNCDFSELYLLSKFFSRKFQRERKDIMSNSVRDNHNYFIHSRLSRRYKFLGELEKCGSFISDDLSANKNGELARKIDNEIEQILNIDYRRASESNPEYIEKFKLGHRGSGENGGYNLRECVCIADVFLPEETSSQASLAVGLDEIDDLCPKGGMSIFLREPQIR